jgi:Rho guanine nucleotide exchange factor 12
MQRWAFEIHSTFIVPGSPLELLSCVSCQHGHTGIVSAVDEVLAKPDREELLRDIFTNARLIALEVIKMRLLDFHKKRNIGLGTFYGPTDVELEEAVNSPERTREIVDNLLACHLEAITAGSTDDPENRSDRQAALGCALATFLKCNGIKAMGRDGAYLVDKWPLFVQKEKSK